MQNAYFNEVRKSLRTPLPHFVRVIMRVLIYIRKNYIMDEALWGPVQNQTFMMFLLSLCVTVKREFRGRLSLRLRNDIGCLLNMKSISDKHHIYKRRKKYSTFLILPYIFSGETLVIIKPTNKLPGSFRRQIWAKNKVTTCRETKLNKFKKIFVRFPKRKENTYQNTNLTAQWPFSLNKKYKMSAVSKWLAIKC